MKDIEKKSKEKETTGRGYLPHRYYDCIAAARRAFEGRRPLVIQGFWGLVVLGYLVKISLRKRLDHPSLFDLIWSS